MKLNTTQLKILGLILMTVDHVGWLIEGDPLYFRVIGRLAAPIFCYFIAQGFHHTKNKKKYFLRLYIAAVIIAVINDTFNGFQNYFNLNANIFLVFSIGVLFLYLTEGLNENRKKGLRNIAIYILVQFMITGIQLYTGIFSFCENTFTALTLNVFSVPYGIAFPLLIVMFYYSSHKKHTEILSYILFCIAFILLYESNIVARITFYSGLYGGDSVLEAFSMFTQMLGMNPRPTGLRWYDVASFQWAMIFSLPFILLYNGEKGKGYK